MTMNEACLTDTISERSELIELLVRGVSARANSCIMPLAKSNL